MLAGINDYNPNKKRKILIVLGDMIADIMTNKKFQTIIKELFLRWKKLIISFVFITQSYLLINSADYLIMEFHNKSELGNIATNHSPDIDLKHFMNIYIKCTSEPYSLLILHPSY